VQLQISARGEQMESWFSQRLRILRESVRWRHPFIVSLLALREALSPLFYWHAWHIFETDIVHQVPQPYAKVVARVKVYTPEDRQMSIGEQISAMGELEAAEVGLRFARGDWIALAFVQERPVGYMWIAVSGGSELAFDTYWIVRSREAIKYGSFVLPAFRGLGIHSSLNSAVCSYLCKRGFIRTLSSVSILNTQSMSLAEHNNATIAMTVFMARIRKVDWTFRKSFRAPLQSRFTWPQRAATFHPRR
jgi:GNAT superfamily N-acetyltransferase